mgnify:CR=1 FL=1
MAAGAACAANLIAPVIPCHRIVGSDGSLHGYYYGLSCKEWLLAHERRHRGEDQRLRERVRHPRREQDGEDRAAVACTAVFSYDRIN